jgi:hypothetical protein
MDFFEDSCMIGLVQIISFMDHRYSEIIIPRFYSRVKLINRELLLR